MTGYLELDNERLEYQISYAKRKSVGIRLNEDGAIMVRAPKGIPKKQVEEILYKKISWIVKNRDALQKSKTEQMDKEYTTGSYLYYKGKDYVLHLVPVNRKKDETVMLKEGREIYVFAVSKEKEYIKSLLEQWYRKEAKAEIVKKVEHYIQYYKAEYCSIKIKSMKTRWGSCSSKRNLNFNWKIIMAPEEVIDYLVVHELAHLIEMNHSQRFYAQIEKVLPNYKMLRQWLKTNGSSLEL